MSEEHIQQLKEGLQQATPEALAEIAQVLERDERRRSIPGVSRERFNGMTPAEQMKHVKSGGRIHD